MPASIDVGVELAAEVDQKTFLVVRRESAA